MITFKINPQCENSRCNKYYLASILLAELIIKDLKPQTEIYYIFDFFDEDVYAPMLKLSYKSNNTTTFDETIESEINRRLKKTWNNTLSKFHRSIDIANDVKEFIKTYPKIKGKTAIRKLNIHQFLDELTPFALEENIIPHKSLPSKYKLLVLLMVIYGKQIHPEVLDDVLDYLEQD